VVPYCFWMSRNQVDLPNSDSTPRATATSPQDGKTAQIVDEIVGLLDAAKTAPTAAWSPTRSLRAKQLPMSAEELYKLAAPSVVKIVVRDRKGSVICTGSGFFINNEELIATNFHVIEKADSVCVIGRDNKTIDVAGVVARDEAADIAILSALNNVLSPNYLQCSEGELPIGSKVYTIGNPLGFT